MPEKLKPCPFCGGKTKESVRFVKGNLKTIKIICVECGCGTAIFQQYPFQPWQAVKKEAVVAWNRRSDNG